jgi:hypothetical protein
MRTARIMFVLVILIVSQAVSAAEPVFATAAETRYARTLVPPKGKAIVYIYQRQQAGAGVSPTIWLNNYKIGRLVPGSFTVWQLAPGRLEIKVGGTDPVTLSLISQAGKVYLFRLSLSQGEAGAKAQLESLPVSFRGELATSRLIKNPRQVVPVVRREPAKPAVSPVAKAAKKPEPKRRPQVRQPQQPGGIGVLLKTGTFSLSKQTQTLINVEQNYDKSASGIFDVEAYFQFGDGLAYGGELLTYNAHYTTVGASTSGDVKVLAIVANIKQYFRTQSKLQPYLGAGLGVATTSVSGFASGGSSGLAFQLVAGLEYRVASYGFFGEAKYVGASTKSSNGEKIDGSGSGIFAGIVLHY